MVQSGDEALHSDPRWTLAVDLFNVQAWYEAHDAFEELWQETLGPDRPVLQAVVQIAVAHVHLERGNTRGATVLLGEALGRLTGCDNSSLGLDLEALKTCVSSRLQALQRSQAVDQLPRPELRSL